MIEFPRCHLCDRPGLVHLDTFGDLMQVTSDCKPWKRQGALAICPVCGGVQKILDEAWHRQAGEVYRQYAIYHQSGGQEQAVFEQSMGASMARSARLAQLLTQETQLPPMGRLLDIGCGNGALLKAFHLERPGWDLYGSEINDKYRREILALPGVKGMSVGDVAELAGTFDLMTLVHVLEHIPHPQAFLLAMKTKLAHRGRLMIQVPDHRKNPFDLLIADHASHFTMPTLGRLLAQLGLSVELASDDWIAKELSVIAQPGDFPQPVEVAQDQPVSVDAAPCREFNQALAHTQKCVHWLKRLRHQARQLAQPSDGAMLAIFGTSIAATWLAAELDGQLACFVDEDPGRIGRTFMGKPVVAPAAVTPGVSVLLALPWWLADKVASRLGRTGTTKYVLPPSMD